MLFHFQTGSVTFFPEDQEYFEERFGRLNTMLGWRAGDEDSSEVRIVISKDKHHSGDKFHATAKLVTPQHGDFFAEVDADNIKKCADGLQDKLRSQIEKFKAKH